MKKKNLQMIVEKDRLTFKKNNNQREQLYQNKLALRNISSKKK